MNKKLIALLAVATMGISVVGATPQTQFTKGETQVDLGAASVETKADGFKAAHKWNFDGGLTSMAISLTHCATKLLSNTVTMVCTPNMLIPTCKK